MVASGKAYSKILGARSLPCGPPRGGPGPRRAGPLLTTGSRFASHWVHSRPGPRSSPAGAGAAPVTSGQVPGSPMGPPPWRACGHSASPTVVCMALPAGPGMTVLSGGRLCRSVRAAGGRPQPREQQEPTNEVSESGSDCASPPAPKAEPTGPRCPGRLNQMALRLVGGRLWLLSACQVHSPLLTIKFPRIIGAPGSHNSSHSRFNLAASNSYLWP